MGIAGRPKDHQEKSKERQEAKGRTLAQLLTCRRKARSRCRCNGKLSPAKAASLVTPPLLSEQFPYYSFQKERKKRKKKNGTFTQEMSFSPSVCPILYSKPYSSVTIWRNANVKLPTERRDYQTRGISPITRVGNPREAVSWLCISDFHVEVACLRHWPQVQGDPGQCRFLHTHVLEYLISLTSLHSPL